MLQKRDEKLSHSSSQSLARGPRNHMVTEAANPWNGRSLSLVPKPPPLAAKSKNNREQPFTSQSLHRHLSLWSLHLDVTTSRCHQHCRTSASIFTQDIDTFFLSESILAYPPTISFEEKVKNWRVVPSTPCDINHGQFGMTGREC